jgi:small conductance mechanosensitive channel
MRPSLFTEAVQWRAVFLAVLPTILVAWLIARLSSRLMARALRMMVGDHLAESSPLVKGPLRLVSIAVFLLAGSLLVFPAFEIAGLHPRTGVPLRSLTSWGFEHGLKVLTISLLGYAFIRMTALLVRRFEHQVSQGTTLDALERAKRARTLGSLVNNVATTLISMVAVLMVLNEVGINIAPVLTGAGIAGLAVGFGAQTLVRDVINGFFLILEDQIRVGDSAAINGVGGLVEQINLRTIVLRDEEGAVHVFPNGSITTLANKSKDFSFYVISLPIPYHEDPDRVTRILHEVGEELRQDRYFGTFILAPVEIMGVDAFADWAMQIKMRIKTVPQRQWEVGRELRKRIRRALDAAGVPVPFPERVVAVREGLDAKTPERSG